MKKNTDYERGLLPKIVGVMAEIFKADEAYVKAVLVSNFPELKDRSVCANCGASMKSYVYTVDCIDALLVFYMAKIVRERIATGLDFTEANQIHLASMLKDAGYTIISHQTITSKHGLIAKVRNEDGTHDKAKGWLITKRGWAFLRGERIPAKVKVWRNKIIEQFEETITISEAFRTHTEAVQEAVKAKKNVKNDYTSDIESYSPSEWYSFGETQQGRIL